MLVLLEHELLCRQSTSGWWGASPASSTAGAAEPGPLQHSSTLCTAAGCEAVSAWPAVGREILGGLQSRYNTAPNKMKYLGRLGESGTREMGDLVEGRGSWPNKMKDFEEERSVQVILMPL